MCTTETSPTSPLLSLGPTYDQHLVHDSTLKMEVESTLGGCRSSLSTLNDKASPLLPPRVFTSFKEFRVRGLLPLHPKADSTLPLIFGQKKGPLYFLLRQGKTSTLSGTPCPSLSEPTPGWSTRGGGGFFYTLTLSLHSVVKPIISCLTVVFGLIGPL